MHLRLISAGRMKRNARLVGAVAVVIGAGCASFQGHELPLVDLGKPPASHSLLSVSYDAKFTRHGAEDAHGTEFFTRRIDAVLPASGVFGHVVHGPGESLHVAMILDDEYHTGFSFLGGLVSGLTVGLIPAHSRDEFLLTAEVSSQGMPIKRYSYRDHVSSWTHLSMVFFMSAHSPEDVSAQVIDNMLATLVRDLAADTLPGREPAGSQSNPEPTQELPIEERLERLQRLRDRGLISDSEYKERRAKILDGL